MPLTRTYCSCIAVITLAFMFSAAGFVSPFWLVAHKANVLEVSLGLIFACEELFLTKIPVASCDIVNWDSFYGNDRIYYSATRLLAACSLLLMVLSLFASVVACIKGKSNLGAPILSLLAGILGTASSATFIAWTESASISAPDPDLTIPVTLERGWAFYMATVGSGVILLFSFVYACASRKTANSYKTFHNDYSNSGYALESNVRNNSYY